MSNVDKWNGWYAGMNSEPSAFRYGDTLTYQIAADFLADCDVVADWGCGAGGFKRFCKTTYIGVDGSDTPHATVKADLATYCAASDGILLRHVLEHDYDWALILENALSAARKKLVLVLFTPMQETTREIAHNRQHGVDVPDIGFSERDIEKFFGNRAWTCHTYQTATGYGQETVYRVWC